MKIISSITQIKEELQTKQNIGFVPTMGALHDGHMSLIQQAKEQNKIVVVSIFVNPTQFLDGEDFLKYPKQEEEDIQKCKEIGVDYLFVPHHTDMYSKDEISILAPSTKAYILEGFNRPKHFDGVLQVVLKLFNIINPTNAYFGKKDAQQLYFVKDMVSKLFLSVNIVGCDIVREIDGLAYSSRNIYLSKQQRYDATSLNKSLEYCLELIQSGEKESSILKNKIESHITKNAVIEYIEVLDENFNCIENIDSTAIIVIAVKFGKTRLLDNLYI